MLKTQEAITEGDFEDFFEPQKHHLDVKVIKCFVKSLLILQSQDKLVSSPPPSINYIFMEVKIQNNGPYSPF